MIFKCINISMFVADTCFFLRFHQVDSDDLTIAVNFWWKSFMMSNMSEHMEAYYLRRILSRYYYFTVFFRAKWAMRLTCKKIIYLRYFMLIDCIFLDAFWLDCNGKRLLEREKVCIFSVGYCLPFWVSCNY